MPTLQRKDFATYYEDTGSGDPVVFICGLSADLQVWRFQGPELSKTHRVITLDNRGAGRSDAPNEPYSIGQMASDVLALLDHLKIDSAHMAGWSMGGVIAQNLALEHPDRVKSLLLLSTFLAPDAYFRAAVSNWVNIRRSNMPFEHVVRYIARLVYSPALANKPKAYEAFIQAMVANPYRQTEHGVLRQAEALLSFQAPTNLVSVRTPATVLVGQHDQFTPQYLSERLVEAISRATLQVLPGAHSGFVEHPDEWTQAIQRALSAASAPGAA